jgi:survival of motor neuron-related-splicing factor 30
MKNKKELETGKAKWQEFAAKGGKGAKWARKDSMFRTGEGVNARVGFTGSGHQMRKHDSRSRHVHRIDDDAY